MLLVMALLCYANQCPGLALTAFLLWLASD